MTTFFHLLFFFFFLLFNVLVKNPHPWDCLCCYFNVWATNGKIFINIAVLEDSMSRSSFCEIKFGQECWTELVVGPPPPPPLPPPLPRPHTRYPSISRTSCHSPTGRETPASTPQLVSLVQILDKLCTAPWRDRGRKGNRKNTVNGTVSCNVFPQLPLRPPLSSHTHTRTHAHTHARTHTHTHTHARTRTHTHARTHACTHTHTNTHTHTHTHIYARARRHTQTPLSLLPHLSLSPLLASWNVSQIKKKSKNCTFLKEYYYCPLSFRLTLLKPASDKSVLLRLAT